MLPPLHRRSRPRVLPSLLLALGLAACSGGGHDGRETGDGLVGGDLGLPSSPVFEQILEVEPNDNPSAPQDLGVLSTDAWRAIAGAIDPATGDPDGYRFSVETPLRLQLSLQFTTSDRIDLDIELYGVASGEDPRLLASGTSRAKTEEFGGYSIESSDDYDFYDLVVRPRSDTEFTRYIFNINTRTLEPSVQGDDLGSPSRDMSDYGDLERVPMRDGELILSWDTATPLSRLADLEGRFGMRPLAEIPGRGRLYEVPWLSARGGSRGGSSVRGALVGLLAHLRREPGVLAVQPNYLYQADKTPDDPRYPWQWHPNALRLPGTWEMTTGSRDVIVAVVDTGVRFDHPDLAGVFTATGYDFVSNEFTANDGDGIDSDPTDPGDGLGGLPSTYHGTHVAGLIAALTDNGLGVAGCAWQASVMPLRVLGRGGGTTFDVANAVLYAAGLANSSGIVLEPSKRAHIVNLSLGTNTSDPLLRDAINQAAAAGLLLVAAAGNNSESTPHYPAAYGTVLAVSAVTRNLTLAYYSNYGEWIDLSAPGGELDPSLEDAILSTFWNETSGTGAYAYFEGTSMSAPQVSAVAALVKAVQPLLGAEELSALLQSTAFDLGDSGPDALFGEGLVDAFAAVEAAGGNPSGPPALHVSSTRLTFDPNESEGRLLLTNAGTGVVDGILASEDEQSGGDWMALDLSGSEAPAQITVRVDRTGLDNGTYDGTIEITSSAGALNVAVTMVVEELDLSTTGNVVVLIMDTTSGKVISQYIAGPDNGFAYRFKGLLPGSYYVLAGTDENGDLTLGDEGELFGIYPQLASPVVVEIEAGSRLEEIDIALQELSFQAELPAGGGVGGYRVSR
ncbi:MAG: S8 family serine peptidase [Planctomycetota bacterium]